MNQLNDHDTAMSDVPLFIEFGPCDNMDYDADTDNEEYDLADDDFDKKTQVEEDAHQDYVTHQELDAMKRMVQEMRRNPELLHQSPVYPKTIPSINDTSALEPSSRSHFSYVKSQVSSQDAFQALTSLPTDRACALHTPSTQHVSPYCQECYSSSVSPTKLNTQFNALIYQVPPLPFRQKREVAVMDWVPDYLPLVRASKRSCP